MNDLELLRQYRENGSESAFRELVKHHLGMVRSVALRQVRNPDWADEVAHAVFIALARKAASLSERTVVAGWLYRATRFAAGKLLRDEERRARHERDAAVALLNDCSAKPESPLWSELGPVVFETLDALGGKDRDAIVLRFIEDCSYADVGAAMGTTEAAAKMRTGRALEKLRKRMGRCGVVVPAAALAAGLATTTHAVVPTGLAASISNTSIAHATAAASATSLANHVLASFNRVNLRIAAAIVGLVMGCGIITVVISASRHGRGGPKISTDNIARQNGWAVNGQITRSVIQRSQVAGVPSAPMQTQPTGSQVVNPDFTSARRFIEEHMIEKSIPSISIAVARRGEIVWEEAFGLADRENHISATPRTTYYVASINKTFTSAALMILHERRQLDLDRPINDYLGAAKLSSPAWNPGDATVRRVANHTAGLTTFNPVIPLSTDDAIRRYGVLFWPPGEQFDYSNLGYKILDDLVARVSGKTYPEFISTEIFTPLGMTHASVRGSPDSDKFEAQRYNSPTGLQPPVVDGIYCSADDLVKFGMFCMQNHLPGQKPILSDTAIDALYNSPVSTGGGKYSLGWSIDDDLHGYRGILAQGGTEADQAWLRLIPSEGIAVVALANSGTMSSQVVQEILSVLLPSFEQSRAVAQLTGKSLGSKKPPPGLPSATMVGNWKGIIKTYREDIPLTFSIAASGEVHAQIGFGSTFRLNEPKFTTHRLSGRMPGDLDVAEDTGSGRYELEFYLYLRDGALKGAVVTMPNPQLPFWAELKKKP